MIHLLFGRRLPDQTILSTIDAFLYQRQQNFIQNGMRILSRNHQLVKKQTEQKLIQRWKFLIRDSKNISLNFQDHQLSNYNFAKFIDNIITNTSNPKIYPYFQQLCIQIIKKSPNIIFNRYYVGNGGQNSYIMMYQFLLSRTNNGTYHSIYIPQKQQAIFNVFNFILNKNIIQKYQQMGSFCSYSPTQVKTKYAFPLILKVHKYIRCYLQGTTNDNASQPYDNNQIVEHSMGYFFKNIVKLYIRQKNTEQLYGNMTSGPLKRCLQNLCDINCQTIKQQTENFIVQYHKQFRKVMVLCNFGLILIKASKPRDICELLNRNLNFAQLIFDDKNLLYIFTHRLKSLCQIAIKYPYIIQKIQNLRNQDGQNMLEIVAKSQGLTHNLIILLWNLQIFDRIPYVKNSKSRKIIQQKYRFCFLSTN